MLDLIQNLSAFSNVSGSSSCEPIFQRIINQQNEINDRHLVSLFEVYGKLGKEKFDPELKDIIFSEFQKCIKNMRKDKIS